MNKGLLFVCRRHQALWWSSRLPELPLAHPDCWGSIYAGEKDILYP